MQGRAPNTSSTTEALTASLGVAEQLVLEAIEDERPGFCGGFISTQAAGAILKEGNRRLSPQKVVEILKNLSFVRHPALEEANGRLRVNGQLLRIYVRNNSKPLLINDKGDLMHAFIEAQAVNHFEGRSERPSDQNTRIKLSN
jgi:hypothetical protein